jgi:hypothetical protein
MVEVLLLLLRGLFSGFQSHSGLMLENVALRQQLAVLKRQARKPKLLWVAEIPSRLKRQFIRASPVRIGSHLGIEPSMEVTVVHWV